MDKISKSGRSVILNEPTGTWFIHNNIDLRGRCKWCGDLNGHDYIQGQCWKCWRSRNPGALRSP